MKQIFFTTVFFSLFLFSGCNQTKETVIAGQIVGNADKVIFSNPNQGTCFTGFRDTVFVDENGKFELRFNLKQPSFISLWNPETRKFTKLLLEPGNQYHILDTENDHLKLWRKEMYFDNQLANIAIVWLQKDDFFVTKR